MALSKRYLYLLISLALLCLYFPINRLMGGGLNLETTLDTYIPILPVFSIPYLLFIPFWIFALVWSTWKMEKRLFKSFMIALISVISTSMIFYVIFPTYVDRTLQTGKDWPTVILNSIYSHDKAYNAFPSNHVYMTTLIALFWSRWFPHFKWALAGSVILVVLSILFTGQHYLVDPLGGIFLAWMGYRFGLFMEGLPSIQQPALAYFRDIRQ